MILLIYIYIYIDSKVKRSDAKVRWWRNNTVCDVTSWRRNGKRRTSNSKPQDGSDRLSGRSIHDIFWQSEGKKRDKRCQSGYFFLFNARCKKVNKRRSISHNITVEDCKNEIKCISCTTNSHNFKTCFELVDDDQI